MTIDIKVPDLGDGIEHGDVLSVLVSEGDVIAVEQGIVELETDKAVAEIPSPSAGRVTKVHIKAGDSVAIGGMLVTLEESSAAAAPPAAKPAAPAAEKKPAPAPKAAPAAPAAAAPKAAEPAKPKAAPKPEAAAKPAKAASENRAPQPAPASPAQAASHAAAGPAMRRLARELGVDLARVHGSGPDARVTKEDIIRTVRAANRAVAAGPTTSGAPAAAHGSASPPLGAIVPPGELSEDKWGPVRRDRVTRIRATIAQRMQESAATIPHVTNFDDADVSELEKIRQASKNDYAESGVRLTTMPFVIKAVAQALRRHPALNASIDLEANEVVYKQYVNIGVAVDTDRGLVVPNLRAADQLSIPQIAQALEELSRAARDASFTVDDLRGGTFTISNLGAIGGTYSTPIINAPEVAILLLGRSRPMAVVINDNVQIRLMLPLSLSYDHRLVDGATAARFLNDVKGYLQAPGRLLLAP